MTAPSSQLTDSTASARTNMLTRIRTALIIMPVILYGAFNGGWLFAIQVMIIAILALVEFFLMEKGRWSQGSALIGVPTCLLVILAFHLRIDVLWIGAVIGCAIITLILETVRHRSDFRQSIWQAISTLAGVAYVGFPCALLVAIRNLEPTGLMWLFIIFSVTWGTDTFAYIGGRMFGKTKLAPILSPKKTVEGAIIGIIGGIVPTLAILSQARLFSIPILIVICIGPFVAIAGDLFESALKRFFQVKDSHIQGLNIFPGHGGVLDRIDALIWVTVFFYGFLALTGPLGGAVL